MKPIELRIQNYYIQTGVEKNPLIMWKYGAGNKHQTAYEVFLYQSGECIFSTGKVGSDKQNGIEMPWELMEQSEYEFQVRVWDENGEVFLSDRAKFITGVGEWQGKWIGNDTAKPFVARKRFSLEGEIWRGEESEQAEKRAGAKMVSRKRQAVLSLCVPGQYEVRLNGEKISPYVYEGSHTDFNKHVHYMTYDVTEFLREGENELTVEVANGWYIGDDDGGKRYFYTMDKGYEPFGSCLCMLAQMKISYSKEPQRTEQELVQSQSVSQNQGKGKEQEPSNREQVLIVSDESWEVSSSKTVLANIYGSEDMDFTREYAWQQALVVEGPKGETIPFDYPPVIEKQVYTPQKIWQLDETTTIFDFGQNMSSRFEIRIHGQRGQVVKVIPAEKLQVGNISDIDPTVPTYSLLTLSGGEDVFRQKFSLNGARWYKVEGVEASQILEFKSYFVTSSAKKTGRFRCSDERLNQIFKLIENAVDSNLNHSHTDCPTIEKLGWLEPDHLMGKAVMFLKDVDMMWSKIALDMRDAQYQEGEFDLDNGAFPHEYKAGLVPSIAPRYARFITDWKEGSFWDIIPWGSSIILAAYEQYQFYGNTRVLKENYQAAKGYIAYLTDQYNDYNRLYGKSGEEKFICAGLGDWGVAQNKGRSRENVETAFYYWDLKVMGKIARILAQDTDETNAGRESRAGQVGEEISAEKKKGIGAEVYLADAADFEKQAEAVCRLYNKSLLVRDENSGKGDKWSESMEEAFERLAKEKVRGTYYRAYDVSEELALTQTNQAIPLMFGMVPEMARKGVEETLLKLCEGQHLVCGEIGLVYILRALMAMRRNDVILDMITKEQHPSYLRFVENGETTLPEFWRDDARSRNHDMMGHIMEWFFTGVAGIWGTPGFEAVFIEPGALDLLESFECEYDSIRGKIKVVCDGGKLHVETPHNMKVVL